MIKIKKRVSLEFLGEDYKDSYLAFNAIPMSELEESQIKAEKEGLDKGGKEALQFIRNEVTSRFVGGEIDQDGTMTKVTAEDLAGLPAEVFIESYAIISGQKVPKANDDL